MSIEVIVKYMLKDASTIESINTPFDKKCVKTHFLGPRLKIRSGFESHILS